MESIKKYILSSFNKNVDIDAKQFCKNSRLKLLQKRKYKVFISPIQFINFKNLQREYTELIEKALQTWSNILNNEITFEIIPSIFGADIKVFWAKEVRKSAGIQFVEENPSKSIICTTIGIMDINGNKYSSNTVYHIILHEFGHVLGLGHSPNKRDLMNPGGYFALEPSKIDKLVLKLLYSIGPKTYQESQNYIEEFIYKNFNQPNITPEIKRNILEELENIGNINKNKLRLKI